MLNIRFIIFLVLSVMLVDCADDYPYLSGHIKRATDAIMTPCDPYNRGALHTCVVFASAFSQKLLVYDATADELVLSPMAYFPLYIKVGTLTNKLAHVTSADQKFPYFLALDHGLSAIFAVRAFPSIDDKHRSFTTPKAQPLPKNAHKPYQIAAWQGPEHVFALVTYREGGSVMVVALDKNTGLMIPTMAAKNFALGVKPSHVAITADTKSALISDEGSKYIYQLDLTTMPNVIAGAEPTITKIDIDVGMATDKIYLEKRDFGKGPKNYLAALKAEGSELLLIDVDAKTVEASIIPKVHPRAAYFPDSHSNPYQGEASWLAVADLKGQLYYYAIKSSQGKVIMPEIGKPIDLTLEKNLALSQLQLIKIIGGHVEEDSSLKREAGCLNNRRMFYIASWGSDRPKHWSSADSMEVEAQGYSCEGAETASRFGYKRE